MSDLEPGSLIALKTLHEAQVIDETAEALVIEIPVKLASKVLSILKPVLPQADIAFTLHHLRRLVTRNHLPSHLRPIAESETQNATTKFLLIPPPLPASHDGIIAALNPHMVISNELHFIHSTPVPLHPPITAEQAATWTERYWPCTFNPAAHTVQNAPPLHTLRTVAAALPLETVQKYMQLSALAARQCADMEVGREVGAVVVDPEKNEIVAVAGDARRWVLCDGTSKAWAASEGRPEHHALMRVVAMVAEKELRRQTSDETQKHAQSISNDLGSGLLTKIEKAYLSPQGEQTSAFPSLDWLPAKQRTDRTGSYLCHGLDVYLTHEPCVSCSMAIIHSRFRACIFGKRMPGTGGLTAEKDAGGLGYGLFWRKELNWRVMTFQYQNDDISDKRMQETDVTGVFHA